MGKGKIFDTELVDEIVQYVELGNYVNVACAAAGITEASYYSWVKIGGAIAERMPETDPLEEGTERPDDVSEYEWECFRFLSRVRRASARGELYAVGIVRKHMKEQWTAAMTFLERRHPDKWKRRDLTEVAAADASEARDKEAALLSDPDAQRLLHEALERVALPRGPRSEEAGTEVPVDAEVVEE